MTKSSWVLVDSLFEQRGCAITQLYLITPYHTGKLPVFIRGQTVHLHYIIMSAKADTTLQLGVGGCF